MRRNRGGLMRRQADDGLSAGFWRWFAHGALSIYRMSGHAIMPRGRGVEWAGRAISAPPAASLLEHAGLRRVEASLSIHAGSRSAAR